MEQCASHAYYSPVCLALILVFAIEWQMLALVAVISAFSIATSVSSVAACVAFSIACDTICGTVEV